MTPPIRVRSVTSTGFSLIAEVAIDLGPTECMVIRDLRVYPGGDAGHNLDHPHIRRPGGAQVDALTLPKEWRPAILEAILAEARQRDLIYADPAHIC